MLSAEIDRWRLAWLNEDGGVERLDRLLKMRERESRAVLATARALRLTKPSTLADGNGGADRQQRTDRPAPMG